MFNFADKLINKKALKRALRELDEELLINRVSYKENVEPVREYKTTSEADSYKQLKLNNALSKPQTEAVDLKHFKDWRNINKVESNNPPYVPKKRFSFDDDDEGEQPAIENPVATNKNSLIDKIASINNDDQKEEKKDTSISDFFMEKYKTSTSIENLPKQEQKQDETIKQEKTTSIRSSVKTSLNELLKKKREEESLKQISEEKKEDDIKPIKIEVVDFSEKKETTVTPKKKVTNRKPRGKNKRRFDADVISSIDWK